MQTRYLPVLFALTLTAAACSDRPEAVAPQQQAAVPIEADQDLRGTIAYLEQQQSSNSRPDAQLSLRNDIALNETQHRTDFVVGGLGLMRDFGKGTINIAGISGTVTKATLYWHGPTNSTNPLIGANVFVNGTPVTGSNIGFSSDNCWGFSNSQAWAADVTALVAATRNGAYNLTGFGAGFTVNSNGASLIVFFDDGNSANDRDAVIFHGNDSNINNAYDAPGWNVTLAGINYTTGTANMQLHVADGQGAFDDAITVNGVPIIGVGPNFSGSIGGSGPNNYGGSLWDIRSFDVTPRLTPGPNTLSLRSGVYSDCLALVVAIVDLPAGAAPPPPNTAPELTLGGPYTGNEGSSVGFSFSATDADADDLEFTWDFGDGTTGSGASLPSSHTYADEGTYVVSVTATDDDDAATTRTVNVTVANVAPTINLGADASIFYADSHTFNGSLSDPGADVWSYSINWGNGVETGTFAGTGPVSLSRLFPAPGVYTVTITVNDGDGGIGTDEAIVNVRNREPVAKAGADQTVECTIGGTRVQLDGSASFDPDPTGRIVSYAWTPTASGVTPVVMLPVGVHNVELLVTDDFGGRGVDNTVITVHDTQSPTVSIASPMYFWPPNHKYVNVNLGFSATDACNVSSALTATATIVSNEADDAVGTGDGNTTGDIRVTRPNGDIMLSSNAQPVVSFNPATDNVQVRVERFGTLAPREYTIVVRVSDAAGNVTSVTTKVIIDHNQ